MNSSSKRVDLLIFHNIAWAHYKASVFSELARIFHDHRQEMMVADLALTERRRAIISDLEQVPRAYPHTVFWSGSIEETSQLFRCRKLVGALFRWQPKVVLVSGYYEPAYVVAILLAKAMGKKVLVSVDSTARDKPRHWITEFPKRVILGFADGILGYGSRSREYCLTLGVPDHKITIRCQATDHERIAREHDLEVDAIGERHQPAFAYVGRLSPEKNVESVVDAFMRLASANPEAPAWKLLIVGDGPSTADLKKRSAGSVWPVEFSGGVAWYDVARRLAHADVLILPSTSEPWGLVVNEAMICGKAVIVSNACGCAPDLVAEGVNGFTFDPRDEKQLESAMKRFIDEPALSEKLGLAGRDIIGRFTPSKAAEQMYSAVGPLIRS